MISTVCVWVEKMHICINSGTILKESMYVQYTQNGIAFILLCVSILFADNAKCQLVTVKPVTENSLSLLVEVAEVLQAY